MQLQPVCVFIKRRGAPAGSIGWKNDAGWEGGRTKERLLTRFLTSPEGEGRGGEERRRRAGRNARELRPEGDPLVRTFLEKKNSAQYP